tara:strand:- start:586 stop:1815 length:1230 start_codon:yes stop_codon:yes gene_type:complete
MDNLLEFLQSDTFQQIIMLSADIIIYYAMLAPQLFSGALLTGVSVGGGSDLISDGIFLVISLIMLGGTFIGLIMDTGSFIINVGGEAINLFDEFTKINFKGGMTGLKKQLKSLFGKLEKKTGFKEQMKNIFETILSLIDAGGKLLADFLSMIIPNDGGVVKGSIGSAINALKVAVLAGRSFPSVFDILEEVYNMIPKEFTKLLESSKYLEEFLTNIVDGIIFLLGKVKFMGEPATKVEQVAGFSNYFVVAGLGKNTSSVKPSMRQTRKPAPPVTMSMPNIGMPGVPGLPDLPSVDLPTMDDFKKGLENMTNFELPDPGRINKLLSNPIKIEVPSLQQLEAQTKTLISKNLNVEQMLNAVVIPVPYEVKDIVLKLLMMLRSSIPALSELALTTIPLTMTGIYAIEYAIKL